MTLVSSLGKSETVNRMILGYLQEYDPNDLDGDDDAFFDESFFDESFAGNEFAGNEFADSLVNEKIDDEFVNKGFNDFNNGSANKTHGLDDSLEIDGFSITYCAKQDATGYYVIDLNQCELELVQWGPFADSGSALEWFFEQKELCSEKK